MEFGLKLHIPHHTALFKPSTQKSSAGIFLSFYFNTSQDRGVYHGVHITHRPRSKSRLIHITLQAKFLRTWSVWYFIPIAMLTLPLVLQNNN